MWTTDIITPEMAKTLSGLFCERVRRTPHATAYRYFDAAANDWKDSSWAETAAEVPRWQAAFAQETLQPGDRVAVMLHNCREWVLVEQAALGSGLVVVPLAPEDRAENAAYILEEVAAKLLIIGGEEQWQRLRHVCERFPSLVRIVSLQPVMSPEPRLRSLEAWLPQRLPGTGVRGVETDPHALATIIYTSGTTGRPKGVMLSHCNILWNAYASLNNIQIFREDLLLSILPLFHALERTAGYYLPMMAGATVAFARAPSEVKEDLVAVRPTVLIAVPRLFERAHAGIQTELQKRPKTMRRLVNLTVALGWRHFECVQGRGRWHPSFLLRPLLHRFIAARILAQFGGRLRLAICGGAPLSPALARQFISLGLPLLQGYGLTEAGPVVSANLLQDNDPASVGRPLRDVQVRLGGQGELLVKSPGVMRGYWHNPRASAHAIDAEGWLHTGDQARIEDGHVYITGRLKDIIALSTGKKVSPADIEAAITLDPLFEQIMVVGESRPYLGALAVLNPEHWAILADELDLHPYERASLDDPLVHHIVLDRIAQQLQGFPGHVQIRRVFLTLEPWAIENGLVTSTLKVHRDRLLKHYSAEVAALYEGGELSLVPERWEAPEDEHA